MGDNEYSNNNINNKDSSNSTNDEFIVRVPQIKAIFFTKDEKKTGNTI